MRKNKPTLIVAGTPSPLKMSGRPVKGPEPEGKIECRYCGKWLKKPCSSLSQAQACLNYEQ
jgi:hypothetical protein